MTGIFDGMPEALRWTEQDRQIALARIKAFFREAGYGEKGLVDRTEQQIAKARERDREAGG